MEHLSGSEVRNCFTKLGRVLLLNTVDKHKII